MRTDSGQHYPFELLKALEELLTLTFNPATCLGTRDYGPLLRTLATVREHVRRMRIVWRIRQPHAEKFLDQRRSDLEQLTSLITDLIERLERWQRGSPDAAVSVTAAAAIVLWENVRELLAALAKWPHPRATRKTWHAVWDLVRGTRSGVLGGYVGGLHSVAFIDDLEAWNFANERKPPDTKRRDEIAERLARRFAAGWLIRGDDLRHMLKETARRKREITIGLPVVGGDDEVLKVTLKQMKLDAVRVALLLVLRERENLHPVRSGEVWIKPVCRVTVRAVQPFDRLPGHRRARRIGLGKSLREYFRRQERLAPSDLGPERHYLWLRGRVLHAAERDLLTSSRSDPRWDELEETRIGSATGQEGPSAAELEAKWTEEHRAELARRAGIKGREQEFLEALLECGFPRRGAITEAAGMLGIESSSGRVYKKRIFSKLKKLPPEMIRAAM
jgi:hypothetical protein